MTEASENKVTLTDIRALARSVLILNINVRNLNRALFGETSKGPDDELGEVGRRFAEAAQELEVILKDLIGDFERRENG